MSSTPELEKDTWTADDFALMGWHDAYIHAVAVNSAVFELAFDLDYILQWNDPAEGETHFTFWVAPATLVFQGVYSLKVDLETHQVQELNVLELSRANSRPTPNGKYVDWDWTFALAEGSIAFTAHGFTQCFRAQPKHIRSQSLSREERGGVSFATQVGPSTG